MTEGCLFQTELTRKLFLPASCLLAASRVSQQSQRVLMGPGLLVSIMKHFKPRSESDYFLLKAALSGVDNEV